jgi:hypothetical protein
VSWSGVGCPGQESGVLVRSRMSGSGVRCPGQESGVRVGSRELGVVTESTPLCDLGVTCVAFSVANCREEGLRAI